MSLRRVHPRTPRRRAGVIALGLAIGIIGQLAIDAVGLAVFVPAPAAPVRSPDVAAPAASVTPTSTRRATPGTSQTAAPTTTASRAPAPTPSPSASTLTPTAHPTPLTPGSPVPTTASKPAPSTASKPATSTHGGTALAAVAGLTVKGRAPKTGYDRDQFGQRWKDTDHNGCDQRNDILRRDFTTFTTRAGSRGCVVILGTFHDPYTGTTIHFVRGERTSSAVQIDHVIALSDAWQKGAQKWSAAKREQFANDPLNLLASDGSANESKGDGDTATWLPPNKAFRCAYVARQVAVTKKYGLWVTKAEQGAMDRVLSSCPARKLPTEASSAIPPRRSSTDATAQTNPRPPATKPKAPATKPKAPATTRPPVQPKPPATTKPPTSLPTVHPGAFCSPVGAHGQTNKGTPMVCSLKAGDSRARWRSG